jgi:hypothetical protein
VYRFSLDEVSLFQFSDKNCLVLPLEAECGILGSTTVDPGLDIRDSTFCHTAMKLECMLAHARQAFSEKGEESATQTIGLSSIRTSEQSALF